MRLYLIRHGQSANNALYLKNPEEFENLRSHDPHLTEIGQQQALHAAQYLAQANEEDTFDFTHIYVSPMIRAMDTAKPIAEALAVQPEIWQDIHEVGGLYLANGDGSKGFPGINRAYIQDCYPTYKIPDEFGENGWWNPSHSKESPGQFLSRAIRVIAALKARVATNERILLVTHAAFADYLVKALLNQLPSNQDTLFYNHYNTGISRFDMGSDSFRGYLDGTRMHYLNRVDHLPATLRTW
jgi:2,3-bisphosphoglycerate-dependent phosphoglycerate mutase